MRVVGRDHANDVEGLLMLALFGVARPTARGAPAESRGRRRSASLRNDDLRRRILGEHPLDELLEGGERRMPAFHVLVDTADSGTSRRAMRAKTANRSVSGPPSTISAEMRAGIEPDRPRMRTASVVALDANAPDDDLLGADDTADSDDGRLAQRRHRWHAQPLERLQAIVAGQRTRQGR